MRKEISSALNALRFGDLIEVDWLDASETTGPLKNGKFDTPVRSVGYYLGVKGKKTKHLVIAKEVVRTCNAFHYNVIPLGMIETVRLIAHEVLDLDNANVLKKFVRNSMCRFRQKDGWMYFEESNKKTVLQKGRDT